MFYLIELLLARWILVDLLARPEIFWTGLAIGIVLVAIRGVLRND